MSDVARAAGGVGGADLGRRPNQSRASNPAAPTQLMLVDDHDEDSAADEGDRIPLSGESHRGVPLHVGQSRTRLEAVRRDIDRAYELDVAALLDFAENAANAPEARSFACARLLAEYEAAVESRMARPAVDLPRIRAASAGITSRRWQNPDFYCSDLDAHHENAAPREQPLDDSE